MSKIYFVIFSLFLASFAQAADFTIQVQPADNSVSDQQVSSLSNSKVTGLGSLSTKSTVTNSEVLNDALSISKILNLQSSLDSKASASSLGSLATKSTVTNSEVADGALSFSKILNFVEQVLSAVRVDQVYLRYESANSQTINQDFTRVNFNLMVYNTHPSSVTTGTGWEFTAPKDGCYETKGRLHINEVSTSSDFQVYVYYNGTVKDAPYMYSQVGTGFVRLSVASWNTEHCILAGQKIYIEARNNPDARALSSSRSEVWITIRKVN